MLVLTNNQCTVYISKEPTYNSHRAIEQRALVYHYLRLPLDLTNLNANLRAVKQFTVPVGVTHALKNKRPLLRGSPPELNKYIGTRAHAHCTAHTVYG